jgi:hypothetical protein
MFHALRTSISQACTTLVIVIALLLGACATTVPYSAQPQNVGAEPVSELRLLLEAMHYSPANLEVNSDRIKAVFVEQYEGWTASVIFSRVEMTSIASKNGNFEVTVTQRGDKKSYFYFVTVDDAKRFVDFVAYFRG